MRGTRTLAAGLLAAGTLVAGCGAGSSASPISIVSSSPTGPYRGSEPGTAQSLPDITLTSSRTGQPVSMRAATAGKVTLLFFGYTHCPDVCPTTMATLAQALQKVPAAVADQVQVVFVTSDPARDTPARLQQWLGSFDPRFLGLTGDLATIDRYGNALGVPLEPPPPPAADGTIAVTHGSQVTGFDKAGAAKVFWLSDTSVDAVAHDLPVLTSAA
jgi:protein SCO1/2